MRLATASGFVACFAAAHAFSDTAPFLLWSSSELPKPSTSDVVQTPSQVLSTAKLALASCPTSRYLVVRALELNVADFTSPGSVAVPALRNALARPEVKTAIEVPEVVGEVSEKDAKSIIMEACEREGKAVTVDDLFLMAPPPSGGPRKTSVAFNDDLLAEALSQIGESYTVVYTATPPAGKNRDSPPYEADFQEPVHMELKRRTGDRIILARDNGTTATTGSLFDRYQFFSPGVFMSLLVVIFLFSILGVGVSALQSLQVSYGAFEKDMGPAAQKK